MSADFRVQVRIFNNQLRSRRLALGLTASALAEKINVTASEYGRLENLKKFPIIKKGEWSLSARKLADFHKCLPEDLFKQAHADVQKTQKEIEVSAAQLASVVPHHFIAEMTAPDASTVTLELQQAITRLFATLRPQEVRVLKARFWEDKTLDEVGAEFGLGKESIRRIESLALRKLRWEPRKKHLRPFVEGEGVSKKHRRAPSGDTRVKAQRQIARQQRAHENAQNAQRERAEPERDWAAEMEEIAQFHTRRAVEAQAAYDKERAQAAKDEAETTRRQQAETDAEIDRQLALQYALEGKP